MNSVSKDIREQMIMISHKSGHGHLPTCFSVVELILAAYNCMRHDPEVPDWAERDIFILSKGHAALGLYCTLAHLGYFPVEGVYSFGGFKSSFGCHVDRCKVPGIEASTGSLGHGIGLAAGMALGFKIDGSGRRVFCIVGDGEANEGTVWESVLVAANLKLDNLTILFDYNQSQARGLPISNPVEKFSSFGCDVEKVDGHDVDRVSSVIAMKQRTVRVIVADTVKGFGCPTLVNDMNAWHRRSPNVNECKMLMEELNASAI